MVAAHRRPLPPLTPTLDWASTERLCLAVWGVPSPETFGPYDPGASETAAERAWLDHLLGGVVARLARVPAWQAWLQAHPRADAATWAARLTSDRR
jgi:hypothetical protein